MLTLGGDGTVNEAVNGLLRACRARGRAGPGARPALAALPGGSANVFTRALGLPADPVDATGRLLAALTGGGRRTIGLGLAEDRYFTSTPGWVLTPKWSARSKGCARMGRRQVPGFMCGPRFAISTASPIGASPRSPWS